MNYQNIDEKLFSEAAKILECHAEELMYYAWPQTFGSTCGPFPGIGGQAFSTFTVEALSDGRNAVMFCKKRFWKVIERFDPREAVCGKYR